MKRLACLLAATLAVVSCAPSTPIARIEKHPEMYASLPDKDKDLAREGRIAKGMTKEGVLIAMGAPAAQVEMFRDGRKAERWDYVGSYPVFRNGFYGGFGYGYGRYGCGRRGWGYPYGWGMESNVVYVPYVAGRVWFVNGRVDSWEVVR